MTVSARYLACVLAPIAGVVMLACVPAASEALTLEQRAVAIDRVLTQPDGSRVVIGHVSRALHIPTDTLQIQHTQSDLSWGELLIANLISKAAGLPFDQVAGEFRGGMQWEDVARRHRVSLEKLDADVAHAQYVVENRTEDKAPTTSPNAAPSGSSGGTHAPAGGGAGGKGHHRGGTIE